MLLCLYFSIPPYTELFFYRDSESDPETPSSSNSQDSLLPQAYDIPTGDIPQDDDILEIVMGDPDDDILEIVMGNPDDDFDPHNPKLSSDVESFGIDIMDDLSDSGESDNGGDIPYDNPVWEPRDPNSGVIPPNSVDVRAGQSNIGRQNVENHLRQPISLTKFTEQYPDSGAGKPMSDSEPHHIYSATASDNAYSPFKDRMNWEIARWAKLRGPGSTACSELLSIPGVQEALGLSYKNSRELNHIIDTSLPGRPQFRCKQVVVAGESFELYYRPVLDCIRWIFGDPNFAGLLVFVPERHYSDKDNTERLYHDMHTGKWWWDTQVCVLHY